jgi:hypothetical protein
VKAGKRQTVKQSDKTAFQILLVGNTVEIPIKWSEVCLGLKKEFHLWPSKSKLHWWYYWSGSHNNDFLQCRLRVSTGRKKDDNEFVCVNYEPVTQG